MKPGLKWTYMLTDSILREKNWFKKECWREDFDFNSDRQIQKGDKLGEHR